MPIRGDRPGRTARTDVALAVVRMDRLWLVSRRGATGPFAGLWEFPGGKIHAGESAPDAAVRECAEELSIDVEPVRLLASLDYDYPSGAVRLQVVLCRHVAKDPVPSASSVSDVKWVDGPTLAGLNMPAANAAIVRLLLKMDEDADHTEP